MMMRLQLPSFRKNAFGSHQPAYCFFFLLLLVIIILLINSQAEAASEQPVKRQATTTFKQLSSDPQQQQQQQLNQLNQQQSNNKIFNFIEADENGLYILGLFDIRQSNARIPFKCGQIDLDAGEWQSHRPMQNMEAFLWAIEQINSDKSGLLPGIRLGSLVMDTCSSQARIQQQLANLLLPTANNTTNGDEVDGQKVMIMPNVRQILGIVADTSDANSIELVVSMASSLGITTYVTQSRSTKLTELAFRYYNKVMMQRFTSTGGGGGKQPQAFESILRDLLGIGKPLQSSNAAAMLLSATQPKPPSPGEQQHQETGAEKYFMVRMLLGNELLAETIVSFCQEMGWDLVNVIYDDEPEMLDLHDELMRQLFFRNIQVASDEQLTLSSSSDHTVDPLDSYDKILQNLAKNAEFGARVVISLLTTGSSRLLLDSLSHLRSRNTVIFPGKESPGQQSPEKQQQQQQQQSIKQAVNSLLWITVGDREPYYSFGTSALGTISISSSVSLLPNFKSYYDNLPNEDANKTGGGHNKWWPEYMRAILIKHHKDVELLSNECAKWQEPKVSPLNGQCRALTLNSLVDYADKTTTTTSGAQKGGGKKKLAKYLASGWEHNGMEVIDSVAAIGNGLENLRQSFCPEQASGICDRMRQEFKIGAKSVSRELSSAATADRQPITSAAPAQQKQQPAAAAAAAKATTRPILLSELIYEELLRSTFQQADGRLFNMDDFGSGGQVEGKFKLYNLRYLQPKSIGFVKIGQFDQHDGLTLNSSKAVYYPKGSFTIGDQVPIEQVKSTCEDESKCSLATSSSSSTGSHIFVEPPSNPMGFGGFIGGGQGGQGGEFAMNKQTISGEQDTPFGGSGSVNSLFKLDHPLMLMSAFEQHQQQQPANPIGSAAPVSTQQQKRQQQQQQSVAMASAGSIRQVEVQQQAGAAAGVAAGKQPTSSTSTTKTSADDDGGGQQQQQQQQRRPREQSEAVYTMRSSNRISAGADKAFVNWTELMTLTPAQQFDALNKAEESKLSFNVVVLLPLHRPGTSTGTGTGKPASSFSSFFPSPSSSLSKDYSLSSSSPICSKQLDIERSFQHLVALAYGLNSASEEAEEEDKKEEEANRLAGQENENGGRQVGAQAQVQAQVQVQVQVEKKRQIELTTTVIDYCGDIKMAKEKLAKEFAVRKATNNKAAKLPVAIVDFDDRVGEALEPLIANYYATAAGLDDAGDEEHFSPPLHLTLSGGRSFARHHGRHHYPTWSAGTGAGAGAGAENAELKKPDRLKPQQQQQQQQKQRQQHLRVNLLPSKRRELKALAKLLSSMHNEAGNSDNKQQQVSSSGWKLVHLIYTDNYHYRDEFVRLAHEFGICVSTITRVPSNSEAAEIDLALQQQQQSALSAGGSSSDFDDRLTRTKKLFERTFYNYSPPPAPASASAPGQAAQVSQAKQRQMDAGDLNSTRVLVVLASLEDETNQLILEAATESMVQDYVWITSHEWLSSVEFKAAEQHKHEHEHEHEHEREREHKQTPLEVVVSNTTKDKKSLFSRLPRYLLSTRIESQLSDQYRRFFASLSPSIHSPVPTSWFDEFWQQNFKCHLPIPAAIRSNKQQETRDHHYFQLQAGGLLPALLPAECKSSQHLEAHNLYEDDRVPYVIQTIEAIHRSLRAQNLTRRNDFSSKLFGANFKKNFFNSRQQQQQQAEKKFSAPPFFSTSLPGFHIIHRLLSPLDLINGNDYQSRGRRRQNSRDLTQSQSDAVLVKAGIWRDNQLIMLTTKERTMRSPLFSWLNPSVKQGQNDEDLELSVQLGKSLDKLASIKSSCSTMQTCQSCQRQIEATNNLNKQQHHHPELMTELGDDDHDNDDDDDDDGDGDKHQEVDTTDEVAEQENEPNTNSIDQQQQQQDKDILLASASSVFDTNQVDTLRLRSHRSDNSIVSSRQQQQQQQQQCHEATIWRQLLEIITWLLTLVCTILFTFMLINPNLFNKMRSSGVALLLAAEATGNNKITSATQPSSSPMTANYQLFSPPPEGGTSGGGGEQSPTNNMISSSSSSSYLYRKAAATKEQNINDLFILSGLIMLNSTSISFLSLADTSIVCWFRRFGLSSSYTFIISSILVRVLSTCKETLLWRRHLNNNQCRCQHRSLGSSKASQDKKKKKSKKNKKQKQPEISQPEGNNNQQKQQQQQQQFVSEELDPIDENVELTFESLPAYVEPSAGSSSMDPAASDIQQQQANITTAAANSIGDDLSQSNSYHHQAGNVTGSNSSFYSASSSFNQFETFSSSFLSSDQTCEICRHPIRTTPQTTTTTTTTTKIYRNSKSSERNTNLTWSVFITLIQMLISLIWLVNQAPEPTLYYGCWHCASYRHSPSLFQFESLICLILPGLLLILICWPFSFLAFKRAHKNKKQFRRTILLSFGGSINSYSPHYDTMVMNSGVDNNYYYGQQQQQQQQRSLTNGLPHYQAQKQMLNQLDLQKKDSIALVMTTSTLMVNLILLTLNQISFKQLIDILLPQTTTTTTTNFQFENLSSSTNQLTTTTTDFRQNNAKTINDLNLVLANIISGAIILTFLFLYRLNLITCLLEHFARLRILRKNKKKNYFSGSFSSLNRHHYHYHHHDHDNSGLFRDNRHQVLTFNRSSQSPVSGLGGSNKWLDEFELQQRHHHQVSSLFDGAPFAQSFVGGGSHMNVDQQQQHQDASANERLQARGFVRNSYGTYSSSSLSGSGFVVAASAEEATNKKRKSSGLFGSLGRQTTKQSIQAIKNVVSGGESKLQRRQSTGSLASSTAQLVVGGNNSNNYSGTGTGAGVDDYDDDYDDANFSVGGGGIGIVHADAISVASSSNSQLHGNELYPIDCSLQLEMDYGEQQQQHSMTALDGAGQQQKQQQQQQMHFNRSNSVRRSKRQTVKKLSSVKEEQMPSDIITNTTTNNHL